MILTQVEHPDMFDKLKEIVEQQKTFEEEPNRLHALFMIDVDKFFRI